MAPTMAPTAVGQEQASLTQYKDYLDGQGLHWEGEKKHRSDLRIVNAQARGFQIHLFYREIHHSLFKYYGQISLVSSAFSLDAPSSFVFTLNQSETTTTLLDELNACKLGFCSFGAPFPIG